MNTNAINTDLRSDQQAVLTSDPALGLRDQDGRTVAHHAVRTHDYRTLARCLKAKELLEQRDDTGLTPLATAVITGWLPGADQLLKAAPHVSAYLDAHDGTLMHCAAISGVPDAVNWVFKNSPDPMDAFVRRDRHGCTPVRLAAENAKPDAVAVASRLLEHAAEQDHKRIVIAEVLAQIDDDECSTPLGTAVCRGNPKMCELLIRWGAQPGDDDEDLAKEQQAEAENEAAEPWRKILSLLESKRAAAPDPPAPGG